MSDSWQHLSVEAFFSQNNWSKKTQIDANKVLQEIPWLCQKIEDFFSRNNWQGKLISELNKPEFSSTLSVAEFFQFFPWELNSPIASVPKLEATWESDSMGDDELKLEDFGNLF